MRIAVVLGLVAAGCSSSSAEHTCAPLASGKLAAQFDAVTPDGHHLFVAGPTRATSYDDYQVFYGTPDAMAQVHATLNSSSATWVQFSVSDGTYYDAYLPGSISAASLGLPKLTHWPHAPIVGTTALGIVQMTYVLPAIDFNPDPYATADGGGDAGPPSFTIPRDASAPIPGAGLTFQCF